MEAPRQPDELSLRVGGRAFALYEFVEESPLLLSGAGMAHRVVTYFRPAQANAAYCGAPLGPFAVRRPLGLAGSQPLPGLLGQQVRLRPGQGLAVMESPLARATLFRHESKNDFLLVRLVRGRHEEMLLRRLQCVCTVGQTEPLAQVCAPSSRQCALKRKRCIRQMIREVRRQVQRPGEVHQPLEDGIVDELLKWWPARDSQAVRNECKDCKIVEEQDVPGEATFPEDVCILEAMEEGVRRLESLGIRRCLSYDKARKAVEELEALEAQRTDLSNPIAWRAKWVLEQLQLTPWQLAHQYSAVLDGRRVYFGVSGPGDPSGGRSEAVSFLHVSVAGIPECLEIAELQRLSSSRLRRELLREGISRERWSPLARWERLALLRRCRLRDSARPKSSSERLSASELKKCHHRLLQEAFDRQLEALGSKDPAISSDSDGDLGHADAGAGSAPRRHLALRNPPAAAAAVTGTTGDSPTVTGVGASAAAEGLLDDLEATSPQARAGMGGHLHASEEDEAAEVTEMARLRAALVETGGGPPAPGPEEARPGAGGAGTGTAVAPQARRLQMLKVITMEKGPMGRLIERPLFVFGAESIRRFREQQHQAEQVAADVAAWRRLAPSQPSASGVGLGEGGEMSSCVSSGYDSLHSSMLGMRGAASPKRSGSDAAEPRVLGPKRLKIKG